ncbi:hypothetical protein FPQ18DRAFT_43788 [Pyronema domesticum]|nr:hypothetical protein FPQ18DRAFT_43788 [Pyronema domesticum]
MALIWTMMVQFFLRSLCLALPESSEPSQPHSSPPKNRVMERNVPLAGSLWNLRRVEATGGSRTRMVWNCGKQERGVIVDNLFSL